MGNEGKSGRDEYIVQKSNPLYALWNSNLTLPEFKILDTYISRINSHHPENRTVEFTKGELEDILGVKRILRTELKKRLTNLMSPIEIPCANNKNELHMVVLFETADAWKDVSETKKGCWKVTLTCTPKAMQYFFNIERIGYLKYKLHSVTSLGSRYSYILFCYIEKNRFRKTWTVSLAALKKMLGCEKEEAYQQYKYFNNLVLRKSKTEIEKKTDCRFSYTPVRENRAVVRLKFLVETEEDENDDRWNAPSSCTDVYETATEHAFTKEELDAIKEELAKVPTAKLPEGATMDERRAAFLRQKYLKLKKRAESTRISKKSAYLMQMIRQSEKPKKQTALDNMK